jgi:hypothetical protein
MSTRSVIKTGRSRRLNYRSNRTGKTGPASRCMRLDPNSEEFREIAERYATEASGEQREMRIGRLTAYNR